MDIVDVVEAARVGVYPTDFVFSDEIDGDTQPAKSNGDVEEACS